RGLLPEGCDDPGTGAGAGLAAGAGAGTVDEAFAEPVSGSEGAGAGWDAAESEEGPDGCPSGPPGARPEKNMIKSSRMVTRALDSRRTAPRGVGGLDRSNADPPFLAATNEYVEFAGQRCHPWVVIALLLCFSPSGRPFLPRTPGELLPRAAGFARGYGPAR